MVLDMGIVAFECPVVFYIGMPQTIKAYPIVIYIAFILDKIYSYTGIEYRIWSQIEALLSVELIDLLVVRAFSRRQCFIIYFYIVELLMFVFVLRSHQQSMSSAFIFVG